MCTWYKHTHTGKTLRHAKIMQRFIFPAVVWNSVHIYSLFLLLYSCRFWVTQRKMNFIVFIFFKVRFPWALVSLQLSLHHPICCSLLFPGLVTGQGKYLPFSFYKTYFPSIFQAASYFKITSELSPPPLCQVLLEFGVEIILNRKVNSGAG